MVNLLIRYEMQIQRSSTFMCQFYNFRIIVTIIQILDIHSKKARNLLRGVDPSKYNRTKIALEKIKFYYNSSDYKKALLHVRTNLIFENNDVGLLFNKRCSKGISDIVNFSISEITTQINNYDSDLIAITDYATNIFSYLKENNLDKALYSCDHMAELKGTSVFLIRMLSFITSRYQLLNMDDKKVLGKIANRTKIDLMASWFNKPNYASPSTDIYLLFNAVISEVIGNVSHFEP